MASLRNGTPVPDFNEILPMLLAERKQVPTDQDNYLVEQKFDGYRVLAEFGDGRCRLRSKNGKECSTWFPEICESLSQIDCDLTIVDGEMTVLDDIGRTNFDALHSRALRRRWSPGDESVTFCMFDLLVIEGNDITGQAIETRKANWSSSCRVHRPMSSFQNT